MTGHYDISHLDDVQFGVPKKTQPFPPEQLFFGFVAAIMLPGGGILIPGIAAALNFKRLELRGHALLCAFACLLLSLSSYIFPEPTLRKVLVIVFGLALIAWQSRLIRHEVLVGRCEPRKSTFIRNFMGATLLIALFSFQTLWEKVVLFQMSGALRRAQQSQNINDRDQALTDLRHFEGEIRDIFGRLPYHTLREQCRATKNSTLEQGLPVLKNWTEFNHYAAKRVEQALQESEKQGLSFQQLESPLSLTKFKESLEVKEAAPGHE